MRKWIITLLLMIIFTLPITAWAQSDVSAEQIQVDIWPEYDRPEVLVIYRITLSAQTTYPAQLTVRIPREVGEPSSIAMKGAEGALYNLDYQIQTDGDWLLLNFSTPAPEIQVEYYDSNMIRNQSLRNYEFRWTGDFTARNLSIQVQQPVNASQMKIVPDFGSGVVGGDGLTYFNYQVGQVNAGTPIKVNFSYSKPDEKLSFSSGGPIQPIQPLDQQIFGRTTFNEILPWILGVLGFLLIAGGAFWYWLAGRETNSPKRQKHGSKGNRPVVMSEESSSIYCHECGKRAGPGDLFCRACGAKLRIE